MSRELMLDDLKFQMLLAYREGNASIWTLSQTLGMCLSETIDFLALFGIPVPISCDDHMQALETARRYLLTCRQSGTQMLACRRFISGIAGYSFWDGG